MYRCSNNNISRIINNNILSSIKSSNPISNSQGAWSIPNKSLWH